jgi:hypothetical protein
MLLNAAIVLVCIALGWTLFTALLKATARLFLFGLMAVAAVGAIAWFAGWLH